MKKNFKQYITAWAVLLVLFNVIAFVSVGWINIEKYTPSFWIGYIFITLTFIGQLICAKFAFDEKNNQIIKQRKFYFAKQGYYFV